MLILINVFYCSTNPVNQTHMKTKSWCISQMIDLLTVKIFNVPFLTKLHTHTHLILWLSTHTRLTALCPGLLRWAGTRKVKPIWIVLKQETVSGRGISWAICKSALHSRQITTPAPHHSVFTGRMPLLPPTRQRQSTEGRNYMWTENSAIAFNSASTMPKVRKQLTFI